MKPLFKAVSIVVLLVAMMGTIVLVKNNQETRRGATVNETFSSILPNTLFLNFGQEFTVNVWLNTGNNVDKMAGAEFKVVYDRTKLKYLSIEPQSGYTLINDQSMVNMIDLNGESYLDIRLLTMGTELVSAINVAKIKFQAINSGEGELLIQQGKIMITGQNSTWEIASNEPSNYKIGTVSIMNPPTSTPVVIRGGCGWCGRECVDNRMGKPCIDIAPPEGMVCTMDAGGVCIIKPDDGLPSVVPTTKLITTVPTRRPTLVPTRTPTLAPTSRPSAIPTTISPGNGACGTRCANNASCITGMICAPIWWPCVQIPTTLISKIQGNLTLSQTEVSLMLENCPEAQKMLPANYETLTQVKLPTFYGLCRNQTCVNCQCGSLTGVPTRGQEPTRRPTTSVVPTVKPPQLDSSTTSFWKKLFDSIFKNR